MSGPQIDVQGETEEARRRLSAKFAWNKPAAP